MMVTVVPPPLIIQFFWYAENPREALGSTGSQLSSLLTQGIFPPGAVRRSQKSSGESVFILVGAEIRPD